GEGRGGKARQGSRPFPAVGDDEQPSCYPRPCANQGGSGRRGDLAYLSLGVGWPLPYRRALSAAASWKTRRDGHRQPAVVAAVAGDNCERPWYCCRLFGDNS